MHQNVHEKYIFLTGWNACINSLYYEMSEVDVVKILSHLISASFCFGLFCSCPPFDPLFFYISAFKLLHTPTIQVCLCLLACLLTKGTLEISHVILCLYCILSSNESPAEKGMKASFLTNRPCSSRKFAGLKVCGLFH